MKWKYYILLFGLLVFLGETVSIPYIANGNTPASTCKMHMTLKAKMKEDSCKKHDTKKPMNCIDCPLCCLTLTTPFFAKSFELSQTKKNKYCIFKNSLLGSYHDKTWKPPDTLSYYIS